ncbi:MAG: hypothetical protein QOD06_201 [Candidatus Binatota bacterium]|jgi:hypothetical protein|nr:hypothetical protein [Candidatus Binatota bacterium]
MPRPPNPFKATKVAITGTPKLLRYLEDLVSEEGYGNTPSEVARNLVWRGIEELISRGVLTRRRGPDRPRTRR